MSRSAVLVLALVAACGAAAPTARSPLASAGGAAPPPLPSSVSYSSAELARAIDAARAAVPELAGPPGSAPAEKELAARRRQAVAAHRVLLLTGCRDTAELCPPALTSSAADPPVDLEEEPAAATLDVDGWRARAAAAAAAACACATPACVDGWTEELRRLEAAAAPAVQGDGLAAADVTTARGCLWVLDRGPRRLPPATTGE